MVHTTSDQLDVSTFDPLTLNLPLGDGNLDDLEFGWFTPPDSPSLDSSSDIFTSSDALPSDFADILRSAVGSGERHSAGSLNWEAILHGVPAPETTRKHAAQHPVKVASAVMWNGLEELEELAASAGSPSGSSSANSWTPPPSPPLDDDIDFHSFVKSELGDSIILVDGLGLTSASKRKQAEDALALQTKRAKLQLQRPKMACSSSSFQSDTPESKRHTHNVLERKRREDLKSSYQNLRMQVPDLSNAERAPTGQILNKAANFVLGLKAQEDELVQQLIAVRAENQRLRASVAQLQESREALE